MPAIAIAILQALPLITTGVGHLVAYIQTVRTAAQQSGEWTEEHEQLFLAAVANHKNDPAFQPEQ